MALRESDVRRLALLARLELDAGKLHRLTPQLDGIVHFVEQLGELDTEGVEPMAHALEAVNRWAADERAPGLSREQALASAPKHDEECFLVPPVLGPPGA